MTNSPSVRIRLRTQQLGVLLREVLEKRLPEFTAVLLNDHEAQVSREVLGRIQDAIGDELCETGIGPDSEPNARGLQLEELIDAFAPHR